ncbi:MAG: galactokinase [Ruminococcaceae bacterium]|nr:galactokinase [Oscillospiraceae bacterium]
MKNIELVENINGGALDSKFAALYGKENVESAKQRYTDAIEKFTEAYGCDRELSLFSVAGRSELSGNHTDHNRGCVVAASISLDVIAVASPTDDGIITLISEGFGKDTVNIAEFCAPITEKFGTSESIIAGMCAGFSANGHKTGGFVAYVTSNVLKGSGLSSSAAFEDMVGTVESHLYNGGRVDNVEIAKLAQWAENNFFGKPCGLMDQVACAVGGIVAIDFKNTKDPVITPIDFDITGAGYNLCIVNTGGNHADLTDDYASVPAEMKSVAAYFGKEVLREVDETEVIANIAVLREKLGDRAIMRALHFFEENKRVGMQKAALESGDLDAFFENVKASGRSSFCYLQNVYTNKNVSEQGLSLALCLAERILKDKKAAWRVHGGGFAGTIQAFVPSDTVAEFKNTMDACFGKGACIVLNVRPVGATKII